MRLRRELEARSASSGAASGACSRRAAAVSSASCSASSEEAHPLGRARDRRLGPLGIADRGLEFRRHAGRRRSGRDGQHDREPAADLTAERQRAGIPHLLNSHRERRRASSTPRPSSGCSRPPSSISPRPGEKALRQRLPLAFDVPCLRHDLPRAAVLDQQQDFDAARHLRLVLDDLAGGKRGRGIAEDVDVRAEYAPPGTSAGALMRSTKPSTVCRCAGRAAG